MFVQKSIQRMLTVIVIVVYCHLILSFCKIIDDNWFLHWPRFDLRPFLPL
jgi:hypothetical protein